MTYRESSDFLRKIEWKVDIPLRWVLLVLGGITMGSLKAQALSISMLGGLSLYALSNIALMLVFLKTKLPTQVTRGALLCSYITDVVFVSFLVYYTGGIGSDMYLLYCLLVFKAAVYYPYLHSIVFIAFLFCPLYVYVLYLGSHSLFFLFEKVFLFRYSLLIAAVFIGMYTAWLMDSRQQRIRILYETLAEEKKLTDERRRELEAILSSIGDGVIVIDSQCNLIMINPVACEIFETTASIAIDHPLSGVVRDKALISLLEEALEGGDDSYFAKEIVLRTAGNGRETVYEALASPLASAGDGNRGAVAVLRNITKQKELELMKSNFVSVVSHELKTPLHSIKGFVDVILMGKTGELNELQRDFLETARDQAKHLQNMINDLLDFTQFESGRINLSLEEISLAELIDEVIAKLEPLADEAGITLCKSIATGLSCIRADRTRLLQVLTNLVDNAIKFAPAGGRISLEAFDNSTQVQVRVSDTGLGIPPDEREKIFDRFYQIDSSTTRAYRGTGLGLAICKYIIEAHRGRIWVESNDPQGSVFCFTVPKFLEDEEGLSLDFSMMQP